LLLIHLRTFWVTRHAIYIYYACMDSFYNIKNSSSLYAMKEETQRKISHSSSQFQPRRWMEVSGERQAPVAYTAMCSNLRSSSIRSAFRSYLLRTSPATTITRNRTSCVFLQYYQVNSKTVDQITKLNH